MQIFVLAVKPDMIAIMVGQKLDLQGLDCHLPCSRNEFGPRIFFQETHPGLVPNLKAFVLDMFTLLLTKLSEGSSQLLATQS